MRLLDSSSREFYLSMISSSFERRMVVQSKFRDCPMYDYEFMPQDVRSNCPTYLNFDLTSSLE